MRVNSLSIPFGVSRQGSVLSPILFSVYLDDLLEKLRASGVDCYLGVLFLCFLSEMYVGHLSIICILSWSDFQC